MPAITGIEIENKFRNVKFVASHPGHALMPGSPYIIEVAFAGRSNTGKSSVLGALCCQKKLVRSGKTPGVTQSINVFSLADNKNLIDLPGYGYARMSHEKSRQVAGLLRDYFIRRQEMKALVLIVDCRRLLMPVDFEMLKLTYKDNAKRSLAIVLSKADKLNRSAIINAVSRTSEMVRPISGFFYQLEIFYSSILAKRGDGLSQLDELRDWIWKLPAIPENSSSSDHS